MKTPSQVPVDAPGMQAKSTADAPVKLRGKMRLLTLNALDGRTMAARRVRELIDAIETDLGGADLLSEGTRQLVQRAAVLGAYIESSEALWLGGQPVDLPDYLAAVDRQRRVLVVLGLERRTRDAHLPLRERLSAGNVG